MNAQIERRRGERRAEENPAPEYLAMLEVCGGEIRASDRAILAEWRRTGAVAASGGAVRQSAAAADVVPAVKDRRAATP
ncbi:MAG TPA: hypothetical protein VGI48_14590 [Caldimonas sp.]|jgi:hypothetical protein